MWASGRTLLSRTQFSGLIDSSVHSCVSECSCVFFFFFLRIEYVTITPDGFRYRSQIFPTVNGLFRWFKDHYQEPVPGEEALRLLFMVCYSS